MGLTVWLLLGSLAFLYGLFWSRVHGYRRYCKSTVSLHGKTAVVTGGNAGIGKETAIDLARRGARVIIACRNPTLAKNAVKEIRKRASSAYVDYRHLDLASLESVRSFVKRFLEEEPRLDILVNNAGLATGVMFQKPRQHTIDGFEMVFGVNHFGHFLLTLLLLDLLKKSSPSRVVMVSSGYHRHATTALDFTRSTKSTTTDGRMRYPGLSGYPNSKAANIMFARELSRRLKGSGVTAYSVHPGVAYTSAMVKSVPKLHAFICPLLW